MGRDATLLLLLLVALSLLTPAQGQPSESPSSMPSISPAGSARPSRTPSRTATPSRTPSSTPYISASPGPALAFDWRPCPPDLPGLYWVQLTNETCTAVTSLVSSFGWQGGGSAQCRSGSCRCGPYAQPAVLQSPSDAAALSSLIPAGSAAWLGLNVIVNSSTGVSSWAWRDARSSSYGLVNASAWEGGVVPNAVMGQCARLLPKSTMESVSCDLLDGGSPSACTIPACLCADAGSCTTVVRLSGKEYGCIPAYPRLHVASAHVFPGSTLNGTAIPPADSLSAGCGQAINSTMEALMGSTAVRIAVGDVLRVCGLFPAGFASALTFPTMKGYITSSNARACDRSLGLLPTSCLEFVLALPSDGLRGMQLSPVAVGWYHSCSLALPSVGSLRCWGSSIDGRTSVPPDLPLVVAVAAGGHHTCVVLVDGTARCWGLNNDGQASVPSDLGPVLALAAGEAHTCAIRAGSGGTVRCWGRNLFSETAVPSDLTGAVRLAVSYRYTCAVLDGAKAGSVRCWGDDVSALSLSALPSVHVQQVAAGVQHVCVLAAGAGSVHCSGSDVSAFPPAGLPPVTALSAGSGFTCAILAINGSVQCWGSNDAGQLNVPPGLGPMTTLSSLAIHTCGMEAGTGRVVCWGYNDFGEASPPVDARGEPLRAPSLQSSPTLLSDGASAELFLADLAAPLQFQGMYAVGPTAVMVQLQRAQANSTVPVPPAFLLASQSDLKYPVLYTYTQEGLGGAVARQACVLTQPKDSGYELQCDSSSFLYGVDTFVFDGLGSQRVAVWKQPGTVQLYGASRSVSLSTAGLTPSSLDIDAVAASIGNATRTGSPRLVLQVRPGDSVTLTGSGFGFHPAVQDAPWWSVPVQGQLRSCIHLSWWASPASYHNDSACVCNGREDWLGEGELPLSAVTAWKDTLITFAAPLGEGIREVRLCVEGQGLDDVVSPPRSSSSIYLAWDPPVLEDLLPAAYVESTDADTDVSLKLAIASAIGISVPVWGTCDAAVVVAADGRARYSSPLPANTSFALLRHCTATPHIVSSGRCFLGAGYQTVGSAWPPGSVPTASCTPGVRWAQPHSGGLLTVGASTTFRVPLLRPIPNAVLNSTVRVSIWDGGIFVASAEPSSSLEFTRSPPVIKSCSPNPLLLGPVGGISMQGDTQARLTLYGAGFRTPDEVLDPRNGLLGRPPFAEVLIAGEPCLNVSVTRTSKRFAVVTCTYPSSAVGGGILPVTLRMIGLETTLSAEDGSTVALFTECATGYYGQFNVVGHQVCRPCPAGAECQGGVGRAPLAQPGFYNMGLPPRERLNESDALVRYSAVSAVQGAACPPGSSDGGRDLACVLACEPQGACLGGNVCAEGYTSVSPAYRCARCRPRFYRSSGVCVPCPVIGLAAIVILSLSLLLYGTFLWLLSYHDITLCTVGTAVEYAQIISLLAVPTVPWPPAVKGVLQAVSLLRVNIELSAPECYSTINLTPEDKLWVVVVLPAIVVALAAVALLSLALSKAVLANWRSTGTASVVFGPDAKTWSHAPTCVRTALKLLGMLYLPVLKSCLDVWNCTPTKPSDGKDYLSIVFEECGLPGGLQERMAPWAIAGLVCFGVLYPFLIILFFYRCHDQIMEDQLLFAAGTGEDARINAQTHLLRQYAAPLYQDYRPGYHYAALVPIVRKALVCVCTLMLNKSAQLLCAAVVFVVAVSLTVQFSCHPLMTPGAGFVTAISEFARKDHALRSPAEVALYQRLFGPAGSSTATTIVSAEGKHSPVKSGGPGGRLAELRRMCPAGYWADRGAPQQTVWSYTLDWNVLEYELQLSCLLTGLLAIMYTASLAEEAYSAWAVPAVTVAFFTILTLSAAHIGATVGYDLFLQARQVAYSYAGWQEPFDPTSLLPRPVEEGTPLSVAPWRIAALLCSPCCISRARARKVLSGVEAELQRAQRRGAGGMTSAGWVAEGTDWAGVAFDPSRAADIAATAGGAQHGVGGSTLWLVNPIEARPGNGADSAAARGVHVDRGLRILAAHSFSNPPSEAGSGCSLVSAQPSSLSPSAAFSGVDNSEEEEGERGHWAPGHPDESGLVAFGSPHASIRARYEPAIVR